MNKSAIPHAIAQEVLESATNAAEKGLSQFFTPLDFGRRLAQALPKNRLTIADLNCGNGQLLQASANETTLSLLGSDIDPSPLRLDRGEGQGEVSRHIPSSKIAYDATLLYPLLCEVDWTADLFVLNPPWRLFWHRDRLKSLADSDCYGVRQAFNAIESLAPKGTIDSTIATLMMALDRCTSHGEGVLIANNATLERLIFAPDAPHGALAEYVWARLIIPGNPMTGIEDCKWVKLDDGDANQFHTGVIYFARQHAGGCKTLRWGETPGEPLPDRNHRLGAAIRGPHGCSTETHPRWQIVKEQVAEIKGAKPKTPWNLWLGWDGNIRTALSSFETHSHKLDKAAANRLFKLNGESPMQLVLQRAQRDELLDVAERSGWRVQPELIQAVRDAIAAYHSARAPLFALSDIQRLGYCDEQDWLLCKKDLLVDSGKLRVDGKSKQPTNSQPSTINHQLVFRQGKRYPLRTQTVEVTRDVSRPNATTGEMEQCEYTGHELGIFLHSSEWTAPSINHQPSTINHDPLPGTREFSFLDAKLKTDKNTTIPECRSRATDCELPEQTVDFTLQQLVEHFDIPAVPDIATTNPDRYKANLDKLTELENTLALIS